MRCSTVLSPVLLAAVGHGWINRYDGYLSWSSGSSYWLNGASSKHDNGKEDRVWDLKKGRSLGGWKGSYKQVYSTSYSNYFNVNWYSSNRLVSAVTSTHSNNKEDRAWKFTAHEVHPEVAKVTSTCRSLSPNSFDGTLNANCYTSEGIGGIKSYYSSKKKDRQYTFKCCRVKIYSQRYSWYVAGEGDVHRCPRAVYNQPCHVSTLSSRNATGAVTWEEIPRVSSWKYGVMSSFTSPDGKWDITDARSSPASISFTCTQQCEA